MTKDPYKYFRVEARELLEGLSAGILELEKGAGNKEQIVKLLRLAHTLKGAARVVKQVTIADLAHTIEDVLAPHREGSPIAREQIDQLLHAVDGIAAQTAALSAPVAPTSRDEAPPPDASPNTLRVDLGEVEELLRAVSELSVHLSAIRQQIDSVDRARTVARTLVDRVSLHRPGDERAGGRGIRALAEELDTLLYRTSRSLTTRADVAVAELNEARETVNQLRLLPAETIFGPLERAVRDAAAMLGKRVVFRAAGGNHRLDAHVLVGLQTMLLHVVRNAVAHGIELPSERRAAGKPDEGAVTIHAERRGSRVVVTCSDDGQGIDVVAVREAAQRRGMLSGAGSPFDMEAATKLVLESGVTTTRTATAISGRGVGLDVVRAEMERLRGEVRISSRRGKGTAIELSVPVSLSLIPALVVEAAGVRAAIPLDAVREAFRVEHAKLAYSPTGTTLPFAGRGIPFIALERVLDVRGASVRERHTISVVVVEAEGELGAIGVAKIVGTANVVVRTLPALVSADPTVAGTSLDAEGRPELVLSPAGLVAAARATRHAEERRKPAQRLPVMVIDDSLTTRMLEQSILEAAGYAVQLATSAEEAIELARRSRYGVFVVDVEMPGMDGFEFVAATRADAALREVPAILVTSRDAPEDRRRGIEVGAHAYVVKSEFDQAYLLDTIRGLVG